MFDLDPEIIGSGPHVVLLHGLGATRFSWDETVAVLKDNYTCHIFDLPGFGASWPPVAGYDHTIKEQASVVVDYLDVAGIESVRLVGHSMGGGVSMHVARQCIQAGKPDRIAAMALVAPALVPPDISKFAPSDDRDASGVDTNAVMGSIGDAIGEAIAETILKRIYFDADAVPRLKEYSAAYGINFRPRRLPSFMTHMVKMGVAAAYDLGFASINCPVRLIWGENDSVVLAEHKGQRIVNLFGNASEKRFQRCGHVPHEERPQEVIAEIEAFLGSV